MGKRARPRFPLGLAGALLLGLGALGCLDRYRGFPRGSANPVTTVAVADVDGDGRLDLLGARPGDDGASGVLSVRLGDPAQPGGFQPALRSPAGPVPVALAAGPLAPGARPAVVVANGSPANGVSVLLPDPAQPGALLPPVVLQLGNRTPAGVAVGDLTGHGAYALAVAADGGSDLLLSVQGASGVFSAPPVSLATGGVPTAVAMGDLRGTGLLDLVVATASDTVAVLLQDPAAPGTFLPAAAYPAGPGPVAVQIADLDGDGRPDLAVADGGGAHQAATPLGLGILLQDPARPGTFLPAVSYDTGDCAALAVAVADLDGDGRKDIVVANGGLPGYPGSVSVFLQAAVPGTFLAPARYPGLYGPWAAAAGDLDGDGRPDLAMADGYLVVRFQRAGQPGVFGPPVAYIP